jgi:hypothetical protein
LPLPLLALISGLAGLMDRNDAQILPHKSIGRSFSL